MAWFGWRTIGEAQRYIQEADRVRLAESAGAKLISGTGSGSPANPVSQMKLNSLKLKEQENEVAIPAGFEPATHGVENFYSGSR